MNIIVKDKKDIRWIGFPVNALFECELIDVIMLDECTFTRNMSSFAEKGSRHEGNDSREGSTGRTGLAESKLLS